MAALEKQLVRWSLDKNPSEVGVKVKSRLFVTFSAVFDEFECTALSVDGGFEKPIISFETNLKSVRTGNEERDQQVKSSPLLTSESNPTLSFQSNEIIKESEHRYRVLGDLQIFDVTKPLEMEMQYDGIHRKPGDVISTSFLLTGIVQYHDYLSKWDKIRSSAKLLLSNEATLYAKILLQKI